MKVRDSKKPFAEICLPALIYLIVGLTAIAVDITHFVKDRDKTQDKFIQVSIKIVVIFVVTILINLLCQAGYVFIASLATLVTSIYLLVKMNQTIQEDQYLAPPLLPAGNCKRVFQNKPTQRVKPKLPGGGDPRLAVIVSPEAAIGVNTKLADIVDSKDAYRMSILS